MGTVFRVLDRTTQNTVVMKRIRAEVATDPFFVEAFEREYQVLATLDHPRIIHVFDYGVDDLGPYYTMEFLEGQDMRKASPLPYREACLYLRDVATSLALLHARRFVHRDVSPGNVRMTSDGHCKLLDFGALSQFGTCNTIVGTPPTIPPEALANAPLDQRADLYSLGALAFWMLTGRHAYPARRLEDLLDAWAKPAPRPSALVPGLPADLDGLVLSLMSADPLARPGTAAEVIARLTVIGELPPEDSSETARLALSFLSTPRFIGRTTELRTVQALIESALEGRGATVCVEAAAGMGRSRLLEEIAVRAQIAGASVVRVDASMHRNTHGATRALALRLFDALPDLARARAPRFRVALAELGPDVLARAGLDSSEGTRPDHAGPALARQLEGWFVEVSQAKPLVIEVDNVEYADDASLGVIAALGSLTAAHSMLVVVTERTNREARAPLGLTALRSHSHRIQLPPFTAAETLELVRSVVGDAPNVARFSEWLHGRTAGSPLHAVEISRQLLEKQVIRYTGGIWTLPDHKPDAELPAALGDALALRIASLSKAARALAECLSLHHEQPTLGFCRALFSETDDRAVLVLLDELAQRDVLYVDRDGYGFSSTAIRDALLSGADVMRLEDNHRRLGEAFAKLDAEHDPLLRIHAGWHLIRGGDELRGADLIASVTYDAVTARTLVANLNRIGHPIEAALKVYGKYRQSVYNRLPLLAVLAQAGYYEDRLWAERYGDEALYLLDDLTGLRAARRLRRFCGRFLGLVIGVLFAVIRFQIRPHEERRYGFDKMLVQLFATVTALAGVASLSLDAERAGQVAEVLEPFSILPEKLTPVGIYQFCRGLREIARDNEGAAYETFDTLLSRFQNPRYYPTLPAESRKLYIAAAHFARSAFAVFRADGRGALESADGLEQGGLKLYAMIASQLRFLYYVNRGEFVKAAPHREQVEIHAARVGSIWQVETWETAALTLVYGVVSDMVSQTRVAHRLEILSRSVPSMKLHARLARDCLALSRHEPTYTAMTAAEYRTHAPRSYIGWGAMMAYLARGYNEIGKHAEAKAVCEDTLAHLTEADREYVAHFLNLDLQLAIADAGLGRVADATERIDGLLRRFEPTEHPLALGLLHEARARISWAAGSKQDYERSLAEMERWFLPTGTPFLISMCRRLSELPSGVSGDEKIGRLPDSLGRSYIGLISEETPEEIRTLRVEEPEPVEPTLVVATADPPGHMTSDPPMAD